MPRSQPSRLAAKDLRLARRGSTSLAVGLLFRMGFFVATFLRATFFFAVIFLADFFAAVRLGEARLRAVFFRAAIFFLGAVFRLFFLIFFLIFFLVAIGRPSFVPRIEKFHMNGELGVTLG